MNNRTSFFDDDDLTIVFEFQKPDKKHQKDLSTPAILSNLLFRQNPDGTSQQGIYVLYNTTLAYYRNGLSAQPDLVLGLSHSRLNVLTLETIPASYGFSVTKNGVKYDFTSLEADVIQNWITALKSVCVLTNFHDEYKAQKMIGKGSFAKVYLVDSKSTGKSFAVKAFTKESIFASNKSNAKPAMLNEIEIMRALDHENVLKLYEVFETERSIYLVLELIQGKSLQENLKKAGFKNNEARTINVISSILEALAYTASRGVMHRDLKPDNILLDKGDKVKIVDFGLATFIDVPEYIFKKCGTPGYIAPEVFKYDQKDPATAYDDRCDVFSTGCILFYMVFGIPFFDGPNASEILKTNRRFGPEFQATAIIKQELKSPNEKIPKEALRFLLQLLEFDQKKRVTAAQALTHPYLSSVMQAKLAGSFNVYESGGCSPTVRDRHGNFTQELMLQQNKSGSSNNPQRFAQKDSLYLDLGKPEINGRVDTLTSGSANNSLLIQKMDQSGSPSPRLGAPMLKNCAKSSSFKVYASGAMTGQSGAKATIFRNMQTNHDDDNGERVEEVKHDEIIGKLPDKPDRRHSEFMPPKGLQKGGDNEIACDEDDISQENPQLQKNMQKMIYDSKIKHPSKLAEASPKNVAGTFHQKGF